MSSHGPPRELWVPDTGCLEEVQPLLRSLGSAGVESLRLFDLRRLWSHWERNEEALPVGWLPGWNSLLAFISV